MSWVLAPFTVWRDISRTPATDSRLSYHTSCGLGMNGGDDGEQTSTIFTDAEH
jgi:hypothetical protein